MHVLSKAYPVLLFFHSIHPVIRKLALLVLKEVRTLGIVMNLSEKVQ